VLFLLTKAKNRCTLKYSITGKTEPKSTTDRRKVSRQYNPKGHEQVADLNEPVRNLSADLGLVCGQVLDQLA